jgi:hypothetical protein
VAVRDISTILSIHLIPTFAFANISTLRKPFAILQRKMTTEKPLNPTELNGGVEKSDGATDLGEKYEIPEPEPFISFNALKVRIRHHYELASDYYYSLWYVSRPISSLLIN